jgi:hypothetical protein
MNRLMCKPLFFCAALALLFSGCQSAKRSAGSSAWRQVKSVARADARGGEPERAYAEALHATLHTSRIEHKVVTFSHGSDASRGAVHRTVVIYRDTANAEFPWWAMDQHLDKPVWLPNETTARQVQFLARRPATVVEEKFYPADPEAGKNIRPTGSSKPTATAAKEKAPAKSEPPRREPVPTIQPAKSAPKSGKAKTPSAAKMAAPRSAPDPQPVTAKPDVAPATLDGAPVAAPGAPSRPKPALINKETPALLWPKLAPKQPLITRPEDGGGKSDQLAPLPLAPPANLNEPKPIVPKPVPKLRTRPSELDVPKPDGPKPGTSRRGFFRWLFARA